MSYLSALVDRASPSGTFSGTPPDHLPAENGIHVWRTAVIMPFITFTFVALRFYTRIHLVKMKIAIDDSATMAACIAHAVLMAQATYNGMGLHVWQFNEELNSRYYLWIGITSEFYVLGLCGFKCTLLLLYLQVFGVHTKFRWACFGTMFFCVAYLLCNMFTEFFGCHPIRKKWEPALPGHCINSFATATFYGACNMATDLAIAILPLTMIWSLPLSTRRRKIGLSIVLSSGFIAWAVAVVRWSISTYNQVGTSDRPWWAGISFALSILEINTGLICACVASLGPLWKLAYARVKGWSSHGSAGSSQAWARPAPWPSQLSDDTGKPGHRHASAQWASPDAGARGPADRPNASREDEYGLLDMPSIRMFPSAENRSQRSAEEHV
ncbi:hypothetical protein GGS23DRAFT_51052 [Durotheca rogersii]|uniref:uncharacterized protein n=1 Tax=Durotheca rogersii TaxID=419775 RepID=UPI00222039CC|nr:uncharacterized protein GGS23DRAFT_51052 [Durotheca rogersii]KAI5863065.1 hypothetical protein GGS23DRAFT_51052 [Durotheca rogersii]